MSLKEIDQIPVFNKLARREILQATAAEMLGIGKRAIRKKLVRFKAVGAKGLAHQGRGRVSKRRWNDSEKEKALKLLETDLSGFGPTFATEKLHELHGIKVSSETLRQAMIKAGLWKAKALRPQHRKRRPRMLCLGAMVQLDGSPHDWFEQRAPKCTLLVFIDDATSRLLWLEFVESESLFGVMSATKKYLTSFGRPGKFYVDFGSVFSVNTNNPDREKLSQFERAMKELCIGVSHAHSPQAKGRVERVNRTLQDRLVKEMRLRNISTMEAANRFVQQEYLAQHNTRFAVDATDPKDMHRPIQGYNLDEILCKKEPRIVQNDFTILYKKRIFQLTRQQKTIIRPKESVMVSEHLDGSMNLSIRKIQLCFSELELRPQKKPVVKPDREFKYYKPSPSHPWRGPERIAINPPPMESRVKSPGRR